MMRKEFIALLTYVYTRGYRSGHESTVEGGYFDVHHGDYETQHADVIIEMVDEEPERFAHLSQPQPVAQDAPDENGLTFVDGLGWTVQCHKAVEFVNLLQAFRRKWQDDVPSAQKVVPVEEPDDLATYKAKVAELCVASKDMSSILTQSMLQSRVPIFQASTAIAMVEKLVGELHG